MEGRLSCLFPAAPGNLKCERQNKTLKIPNKWENFFKRLYYFYSTSVLVLWSMSATGYESQTIMQSVVYPQYFQLEDICPQWQNRVGQVFCSTSYYTEWRLPRSCFSCLLNSVFIILTFSTTSFCFFVWFGFCCINLSSVTQFILYIIPCISGCFHIFSSLRITSWKEWLSPEKQGAFLPVSQPREGRTCLIPCQGSRALDTWLSGEAVSEFCFDTGFYQNFSKISVCHPLTASLSDCLQRMSLCRLICFGVLK